MMTQEHAFCLAIESLLNTTSHTSFYTQIRVLFDEMTRILNHLLALSTHSLDVGNMAPPKAEAYLRKLISNYWSKKTFDLDQNDVVKKFNPQSMLDAFSS